MKWPGPADAYLAQRAEIDSALRRVLDSGSYVLGEEVANFEREFADVVGCDDAVGVASGTDALIVALRTLGVGPGDRVATVSHTAVATVAAIEASGAEAVLVDIEDASMTMDPVSLARTLEHVGGATAVIPVHLYGHPADMSAIGAIATDVGAVVIEDCSQAHGASRAGKLVGTFGDAAAFSCYPTKNLGALGDAGVLTATKEIASRAKRIRQYGWRERYVSDEVGLNSRMDPLQAAVLRVKLHRLLSDNEIRRAIALIYDRELFGLVRTPLVAAEVAHAFHQYTVRTDRRVALARWLEDCGVPTAVLYPRPVHMQPAYAERLVVDPAGLPVTEAACRQLLCLPIHPLLTQASIALVVESIKRWWSVA